MALKTNLKADKQDEAEAVLNYGQRMMETGDPEMKSMLSGIRKQEKQHHNKISAAIKGLKGVK